MEQCESCGISLPNNAVFCGSCGRATSANLEYGTSLSSRPNFSMGSSENTRTMSTSAETRTFSDTSSSDIFANSRNIPLQNNVERLPVTPFPDVEEREDEDRRRAALFLAGFPAADFLGNQPPQGSMPLVQGGPPAGQMPLVSSPPHIQGEMFANRALNHPAPAPHASPPVSPPSYRPPRQPIRPPRYPVNPPRQPVNPPGQIISPPRHPANPPGQTMHPPKHSTGGQNGCLAIGAIALVALLILLAVIGGLSVTILSPNLSLNGSSAVNPGGTLLLHGNHFLPDSSVELSLDGTTPILLSPQPDSSPLTTASIANSQSLLAGKNVLVGGDGTFAISLPVNRAWPLGHHVIDAAEALTHRSASLAFNIQSGPISIPTPTPTATPTPTPTATDTPPPTATPTPAPTATDTPPPTDTPTPTPTPSPTATTTDTPPPPPPPPGLDCVTPQVLTLGPVTAGSSQVLTATATLCATGSGPVHWSASANPAASWLQIRPGNDTINAPGTEAVTIRASAVRLPAGTYTTTLTFADQIGNRESVKVSLNVVAECVHALPTTLNFVGVAGVSDPESAQTISVTNCGTLSGPWSDNINVGSGGNWLSLSSNGGTLAGGATQNIQATASNLLAKLPQGSYQDTITFSIGANTETVTVNLTVNAPPPPILSTTPTSFNFNVPPCILRGEQVAVDCEVTLINSSTTEALTWTSKVDEGATLSLSGVIVSGDTIATGGQETVTFTIDCGVQTGSFTFIGPANSVAYTWSSALVCPPAPPR